MKCLCHKTSDCRIECVYCASDDDYQTTSRFFKTQRFRRARRRLKEQKGVQRYRYLTCHLRVERWNVRGQLKKDYLALNQKQPCVKSSRRGSTKFLRSTAKWVKNVSFWIAVVFSFFKRFRHERKQCIFTNVNKICHHA